MKKDWILIGTTAAFGLLLWIGLRLFTPAAEAVRITVDGTLVGTYSLTEPQTVVLPHHTLEIKDGTVAVTQSDCAGQDCVHTPPVSKGNQAIVCLPYRMSAQVVSETDGLDTVTY